MSAVFILAGFRRQRGRRRCLWRCRKTSSTTSGASCRWAGTATPTRGAHPSRSCWGRRHTWTRSTPSSGALQSILLATSKAPFHRQAANCTIPWSSEGLLIGLFTMTRSTPYSGALQSILLRSILLRLVLTHMPQAAHCTSLCIFEGSWIGLLPLTRREPDKPTDARRLDRDLDPVRQTRACCAGAGRSRPGLRH